MVAEGELLSFSDWQKLIEHPTDPGTDDHEGAELQDPLEPGEKAWDDNIDKLMAADDYDVEIADHPVALAAQPGDDPAVVAEAVVLANRLEKLKALQAAAVQHKAGPAAALVGREIVQLSRGLRAGGRPGEKHANHVLRSHMQLVVQKELAVIKEKRDQAFQKRRNLAIAKKSLARARLAKETRLRKDKDRKEAILKEAAEKAAKLALLPKRISSADLGAFTPKAEQARRDALERIRLRSPRMTEDRELKWGYVRDRFVKEPPLHLKHNPVAWGVSLVRNLDIVLKELGSHYEGHSAYKASSGGNPKAFEAFFDRMEASLQPIGVEIVT